MQRLPVAGLGRGELAREEKFLARRLHMSGAGRTRQGRMRAIALHLRSLLELCCVLPERGVVHLGQLLVLEYVIDLFLADGFARAGQVWSELCIFDPFLLLMLDLQAFLDFLVAREKVEVAQPVLPQRMVLRQVFQVQVLHDNVTVEHEIVPIRVETR